MIDAEIGAELTSLSLTLLLLKLCYCFQILTEAEMRCDPEERNCQVCNHRGLLPCTYDCKYISTLPPLLSRPCISFGGEHSLFHADTHVCI